MDDADLRRLSVRARTLHERLRARAGTPPGERADARLEHWESRFSRVDVPFSARLQSLGLTASRARAALADDVDDLDSPSPWALRLRSIIASAPAEVPTLDAALLPGERLLHPFVWAAASAGAGLPRAVRSDLEQHLLRRLYVEAHPVMTREIALGRDLGLTGSLGIDDLPRVMLDYPALARRLVTIQRQWRREVRQLMRRIEQDRARLESAFGRLGPLAGVAAGLAEPHGGGLAPIALRFDSGVRLVYKPRPTSLAFPRLLQWFNGVSGALALESPRRQEAASHGWSEYLDAATDGRPEYFVRTGMFLAILYALGSVDFHRDNIIPGEDTPWLIDIETVMQPAIDERLHAARARGHRVRYDVSRCGDGLCLSPVETAGFWPGARAGASVDRVVEGFEAAYDVLRRHKDALIAPQGPLEWFAGQPVRCVLRDTGTYGALIARIRSPSLARDAVDASIEIEALAASYYLPGLGWPPSVFESERRAIEDRLDVPYFRASTTGLDLHDEASMVAASALRTTAFAAARSRILALDDSDRSVQVAVIRRAGASREAPRAPGAAG